MWKCIWQPFLAVLFSNILLAQEKFHIDFERSGGFAGITTKIDIDSNSLPPDEVEKLEQLINDSGFFEFDKNDSVQVGLPDQFRYELTIKYKNERQTIELSDATIPESFRPLINYLNQKARLKR